MLRLLVDDHIGSRTAQRDREVRLGELILGTNLLCKLLQLNLKLLCVLLGHTEDCISLARDCVAQVTAAEVAQTYVELLLGDPQHTCNDLIRISQTVVDVVTRVTSLQIRHVQTIVDIILRRYLRRKAERSDGVDTARATDEDLALVLRVEINQILSREHTLAQLESTRKTRLLINREESLNRTVLDGLIDHHCQRSRHTDTAVGAQRRTASTHPALVINVSLNGVVLEIELHVRILLADHIHMCLQCHGRALLVASRSGLTHHHITNRIALIHNAVLLGKSHEPLYDLSLLLRGAGNFRNCIKLLPNNRGREF